MVFSGWTKTPFVLPFGRGSVPDTSPASRGVGSAAGSVGILPSDRLAAGTIIHQIVARGIKPS